MSTSYIKLGRPRSGALCVLLVLCIGCGARPREGTGQAAPPPRCDPVVREVLGATGSLQGTARLASLVPSQVSALADTVFYADTVDLNCDGRSDFVGQIIPRVSPEGPTLVAFVQENGGYREVLRSRSPVDGPEALALAADLTGAGKRDIVTLGSDEGGHIPRVFAWREGQYAAVAIPVEYHVRQEAEWGAACLQKLNPGIAEGGRVTLLREIIPPTALKGHGPDCALPTDTLRIVGDSLVRGVR